MYNKLKGLMKEKDITQEELSKMLKISLSTLNFKINGKSDFTIAEAKEISGIFKRGIEEIFGSSKV